MPQSNASSRAPVALRGATVTSGFRAELFRAANRAGMTVNEFALVATAEKLARAGADFPGLFEAGDFPDIAV